MVGDPSATVSFHVRTNKQGEPRRAAFQYANVEIFYDDGTTGRYTQPLVVFPFRNDQVFYGDSFSETENIFFAYDEFRGRLLRGGRARGYFLEVTNYRNPPPSGFPDLPDWSTNGRVYWTAQRVS